MSERKHRTGDTKTENPLIKLAEQYGFKAKNCDSSWQIMTHPAGHTLIVAQDGSFKFAHNNGGFGECRAREEYAEAHKMSTLEYGTACLKKWLDERVKV